MTISTTSSNLIKLNDIVAECTAAYRVSKSSADMKNLIEKTLQLTVLLRKFEFNHNTRVLEDFDEDICLEYLGMILSDRNIPDPRHKLRGIISKRIYQHNKSATYNIDGIDFFGDNSSVNYVDNRLFISDIVQAEMEGLSSSICALILYYLTNFRLLKNFITFYPTCLNKFIVVMKVYDIRKKIMNETERSFDITFSKNRVANLLMLSGLFNESPEMFVLLTLFGDFKKFLTFVSLFENKEIKVPKIADINNIFSKSSVISENFSNDSLSIQDRENLLSLVTNVNLENVTPDTKFNKFLDEYIPELVVSSIDNYNKVQEKQLKHIDFTNIRKVKEAYSIMTEEMEAASRLLRELTTTVGTIKEINAAIEQIKTQKTI